MVCIHVIPYSKGLNSNWAYNNMHDRGHMSSFNCWVFLLYFLKDSMSGMKYPFQMLRDNGNTTTCCIYSSTHEAHYLSLLRTWARTHPYIHTHIRTHNKRIILTSISKLDKYVGMYVQKPFWKPREEFFHEV